MGGKKPALGRGLNALFGDIEVEVPAVRNEETGAETTPAISEGGERAPENMVLYIDIDEIKPNSMQPRQAFDPETIEDLASSIETYGIIQPVILTKAEIGYELIAGERRWRAARKAGLKTIPAILREVTNEENALIAIIENMQREDLNVLEEATAYRTIITKYKLTQEELSKAVGKSRPHIANILRILGLPSEVKEMLREGTLTLGHANALGAVKNAEKQAGLAKKIVTKGLSVREAERLASALSSEKNAKKKPKESKSVEIRVIEQELTSSIGVRVVINGDAEKGSVDLKYFDRSGLEEIIDLLRKAGARTK